MSYTVSPNQSNIIASGIKHEIITIPFNSNLTLGSYATVNINELNLKLHELTIALNCSALTGITGGAAWLVPAQFIVDHIELVISNNVIDTWYGTEIWLLNQLMFTDEQRSKYNYASGGPYLNPQSRGSYNSVPNTYYITIPTSLISQAHPSLLTTGHQIQLRVYTNPLSSLVNLGSGATGTPVFNILSSSLVARVSRLPPQMASSELMAMSKKPVGNLYTETRYQPFTIQAGTLSSNLVLSSITGNISSLLFVIRSINPIGDNFFNFTPITSFNLLDSASQSICGGLPITSTMSLLEFGKWNSPSSYLTESFSPPSSYPNLINANAFLYSFSVDCNQVLLTGQNLSCRNFVGNEQLQILFPSALSSAVQVDFFAFAHSVAVFSPNGVIKAAL